MKDAWFQAVCHKQYTKVEELLSEYKDWRTDDGGTGLMIAARAGDLRMARLLFAKEVQKRNTKGETALLIAAKHSYINIVLLLIPFETGMQDDRGRCALYWAIRTNNMTLFSMLMEYEQHLIDKRGATMLMIAAWYSRTRFVAELKEKLLAKRDFHGDTALIYAILGGSLDAAALLLEEVGICNNHGSNALMEALKCNCGEWLMHSLSQESLVSIISKRDSLGRTALIYAVLTNTPYVVKELTELGKDLEDCGKDAALTLAQRLNHTDCIDILRPYITKSEDPRHYSSYESCLPSRSSTPTLTEVNNTISKHLIVDFSSKESFHTKNISVVESESDILIENNNTLTQNIDTEKIQYAAASHSDTTSPVYGHEFNYLRRNLSKTAKKKRGSETLAYDDLKVLFSPREQTKRKLHTKTLKKRRKVRHKKKFVRRNDTLLSFRVMDAPSEDSYEKNRARDQQNIIDEDSADLMQILVGDSSAPVSPNMHALSRPPSVWTSISKRESVTLNEKRARKYSKRYIRALTTGNILLIRQLGPKEKDYGHYHGDTALMYAVRINNPSMIRVLAPMEAGRLNPAGESALMIAARENNFFAVRFLLPYEAGYQDSCKYTALMHAAQEGHTSIVNLLMNKEKTMQNRIGETALMLATRYYYSEIMALLSPFEGHIADYTGLTPLMCMTLRNDRNMVRLLAPHGARQRTARGTTALMMAVSRGYYECAGILHEKEAGIQDNNGRTALMIAAGCGNIELVRLMVGVEANMKDNAGRRASDYARSNRYSNVLFFLHRWESW